MEKIRSVLNKALNLLAGLSMAVMVLLTTYQVIVRYIFNSPSTWSEELVGYLFGWSTMLGATIVSGERGHMNIPVLVDRFNPTMRKAFHIFAEVIAFIFSAAILVFGGVFGFGGMMLGVPIFTLLYSLINDFVNRRLMKRRLPTQTEQYERIVSVDDLPVAPPPVRQPYSAEPSYDRNAADDDADYDDE